MVVEIAGGVRQVLGEVRCGAGGLIGEVFALVLSRVTVGTGGVGELLSGGLVVTYIQIISKANTVVLDRDSPGWRDPATLSAVPETDSLACSV